MVVAGALYFRRATPAGGLACLVLGIGYTAIAAAGGWSWFGQVTGWEASRGISVFFAWDHTLPATRVLVGMPLAGAVLLGVSVGTAPGEPRSVRELFAQMRYQRAGWSTGSRAGAVVTVVGLTAMIVFGFIDARLPDSYRPWNVLAYLAVLTAFVAGMIKVADALLPVPEPDRGEVAAIERSWLARHLATGRAWLMIYALAVVMLLLYWWV